MVVGGGRVDNMHAEGVGRILDFAWAYCGVGDCDAYYISSSLTSVCIGYL